MGISDRDSRRLNWKGAVCSWSLRLSFEFRRQREIKHYFQEDRILSKMWLHFNPGIKEENCLWKISNKLLYLPLILIEGFYEQLSPAAK